jgi:dCTP deaminase
MILSKDEIRRAIDQGTIRVKPPPQDFQYSNTSLDLRLGRGFHRWDRNKMDALTESGMDNTVDPSRMSTFSALSTQFMIPAEVDAEGCHIIRPREFVLGITHEWVELPLESAIAARVEGRSSLARMGLAVHLTAPTIQAGWSGKITLEMINLGIWPIKLSPYELRACQLIFERVGESSSDDSPTQFQGQELPTG